MKIKHTMAAVLTMLGISACSNIPDHGFEVDKIETADGKELTITFIKHASLAIRYDGHEIYVDPVGEYADYGLLPKADVILITHAHSDHFDTLAIASLRQSGTVIVANPEAGARLPDAVVMRNGDELKPVPYLDLKAVPAYNTTEGRMHFHPQHRDNGYVLTLGGTRIYIAGDTEDIPDMAELQGIDIAFLPVNLPYTMTPEQAADAARMVSPAIFYPYHYGETDLTPLSGLLENSGIEVRIRQMQ